MLSIIPLAQSSWNVGFAPKLFPVNNILLQSKKKKKKKKIVFKKIKAYYTQKLFKRKV
jgi:hypothetical protein